MPRGVYVRKIVTPAVRLHKLIQVCMHGETCAACCWPWQASVNNKGYGQFNDGTTIVLAHRRVYELHHGPLAEGQLALHTCDWPRCCSWHHLYGGGYVENWQDMRERGHAIVGERHYAARLTEASVTDMRRLRTQGYYYEQIAMRFGVAIETARDAIHGVTWKHVPGALPRNEEV